MEPFISIIIVLVVVGLIYWLVTTLPIPEPFMTIIKVVAVIGLIMWLLTFI